MPTSLVRLSKDKSKKKSVRLKPIQPPRPKPKSRGHSSPTISIRRYRTEKTTGTLPLAHTALKMEETDTQNPRSTDVQHLHRRRARQSKAPICTLQQRFDNLE